MYQTKNGWTKAKMIEHIKLNFKGRSIKTGTKDVCMYRGPDGKKCGVGLFIPDPLYDPIFEGRSAEGLKDAIGLNGLPEQVAKLYPEILAAFPLKLEGMQKIQNKHDEASNDESALDGMIHFIEDEVEDEKTDT